MRLIIGSRDYGQMPGFFLKSLVIYSDFVLFGVRSNR